MSSIGQKLVDVQDVDVKTTDVVQVQQHDGDGGTDEKLTFGSGEEKFKMAATRRLQKVFDFS